MIFLRQSTASQKALLGPFQDDTDFKTAKTALTIANTDIKLIKAGATSEANKNSGGGTHVSGGYYSVVFDATDTNTLGSGVVRVKMAASLEVWEYFTVLSAQAYDTLFGATLLPVDAASIGGVLTSTRRVPMLGIADQGTAASISGATLNVQTGHGYGNNTLNGSIVAITGGTLGNYPQWRSIVSHTGDAFVLDTAPTVTPTGTITYIIFGIPASNLTAAIATIAKLETFTTATQFTATALALAPAGSVRYITSGTADSGSSTTMVDAARTESDVNHWAGQWILPMTGAVAGQCRRITAFDPTTDTITFTPAMTQSMTTNNYEILPAGTVTPDMIADAVLDELIADHAISGSLGAAVTAALAALVVIDDFLDTEIAAIKTKTDALPADTNTAISTLLSNLAAVKAKSDLLTFDGTLVTSRVSKIHNHVLQDNGVGGKNIGATV